MDDIATEPLKVPLYERAEIRPCELASLNRRIIDLGNKLAQAEGERDTYERIINILLEGLGFDAGDWISETGAREAIAALKEICKGLHRRDECEPIPAGSVIAAVFDLLERERKGARARGRAYPLRKYRRGG